MIVYTNRRLQKAVVSYATSAVLIGTLFGGLMAMLWAGRILGLESTDSEDISVGDLTILSLVVIFMTLFFSYLACAIYPEVRADQHGLKVRIGVSGWRFLSWDSIRGIVVWTHISHLNPSGRQVFVEVQDECMGPIHYNLMFTPDNSAYWVKGFRLMGNGKNYRAMVDAIESRLEDSQVTTLNRTEV
jgi:hypothetical protein